MTGLARLEAFATVVGRGITPRYATDGTFTVFNQKCVRDGSVSSVAARRHDATTRPVPANKRLSSGDCLVNSTGQGTLGRTGYVRGVEGAATVDSHITIVRPHPTTDSRWLAYALRMLEPSIEDLAIGSTGQTELPRDALASLPIPNVAKAEQQAIAEVLGALDDKIAANTALAATADLYASTVLLDSLGAGRVRLASVALITMGSSPKGDTLNELGQGVPFYQGVRDFGFRSPTRRVFTTAPVRSANAGDILVSVRAPVGDVNIADEPVCIGRGIAAVRSTTGTQATLLHQLKAERDVWEPFEAEGTVFGSINRDQLHGIQLHAVAPERVEFVEKELAAVESSIAATLAENRTLAATRDALLPPLMSGKLRVRDAEAAASAVL